MTAYKKFGDLLLRDGEKEILSEIAPSVFVEKSREKELREKDEEYLIHAFQCELREALQLFLNGGFSKSGYAAYPFIKGISKENISRMKNLAKLKSALNEQSKRIASFENVHSSSEYAKALSSLYQEFGTILKPGKISKKRKSQVFDISSYHKKDFKYLSPIVNVQNVISKKIENFARGFYLHGSLATNDFVKGWSDFDTLCIVRKKALQNPAQLIELRSEMVNLRRYFYQIDPLQHHGVMIMSEYDLDSYPQSFFPIKLFDYAKSFGDDAITSIRTRSSKIEALAKLFWFVNYFRKMKEEKQYKLGSYELKNLLHLMALFPSLYLQVKGIMVYKKFSFNLAKKDFDEMLWKPIDVISSIRKNWNGVSTFPFVGLHARMNPIAAYQLNSKLIDMSGVLRKMNINVKNLVEGMHSLSEVAWEKTVKTI